MLNQCTLCRRVRVAEYYRIPYEEGIEDRHFAFYDESKDAWQKYSWHDLFNMSRIDEMDDTNMVNGRIVFDDNGYGEDGMPTDPGSEDDYINKRYKRISTKLPNFNGKKSVDFMISARLWRDIDPVNLPDGINLIAEIEKMDLNPHFTEHYSKMDEVFKACGASVQDPTPEEIQNVNANFIRFLKDWLRGESVPYHVNAFLQTLNWQGYAPDCSLPIANNRAAHFGVSILKFFLEKSVKNMDPYSYSKESTQEKDVEAIADENWELVIVRPNIEHNMLGLVMGRGGLEELGATFWGQTELSCFDDSMHGKLFLPCPSESSTVLGPRVSSFYAD